MASSTARKAVLVLTSVDDGTADPVIHHLAQRDIPVVRMDPGDFPSAMTVEAEFGDDRWRGTIRDAFRGVDLESVRSVYFRRPSQFTLTEPFSSCFSELKDEHGPSDLAGPARAAPQSA